MPQKQSDEHPSGVVSSTAGSNTARARERKANAALQLRIAGASWEDVAQAIGYPTARAALVATEQALERELQDSSSKEMLRSMAGKRLERLLRAVWGKAIDPDNPEQLPAVQRARDLIDRHAKLFGLDAPTEVVVSSPTKAQLEAWVAQVEDKPQIEEGDIFDAEVVEESDAAV